MQVGPFTWHAEPRQLCLRGEALPLAAREASVFALLAEGGGLPVPTRRLLDAGGTHAPRDPKSLWDAVAALNQLLQARGDGQCFVAHHPSDGFSIVAGAQARVIGRGESAARIGDQLARHRFVTILGSGGLGKTTVARLLAGKLTVSYPDGVHMVDLSRLTDGRLVAPAVGTSMGLVIAGPDPLASLAAFAHQKTLLLVLDSCEHVAEGAARVAQAMLAAGDGVHVLTTSREPLLAAGERLYRLPALENSSAVELFVQRVRERDAAFAPRPADLERVAAICRKLDGLPLAIEIVAARASELGLADLGRQLDERLLFVEGAAPQAPARHHTLAAMMDWSHDQLGLLERVVLRQLSIFRGRFTLEAAQAVVGGPGVPAREVRGAVLDLVDKSLLSRTPAGAYRLLDTTRVYAATKLPPGERAALSDRHARYVLAVLKRAEADWMTMDVRAWQDEYGEWINDLRVALDTCFAEQGDEQLGVELAFAGFELGRQMSLDAQFRHYMQRALTVLERRPARDYLTEITLRAYLGSMGQMIDLDGSPLHRALEDLIEQQSSRITARVQIIAVGSINHAALMAADFATATQWAEHAIAAARDSGDAVAVMIAQRMNAQTRHFMGRHADAECLALSVLASRCRIPLTYIPSPVEPRVSMRLLLARVHWMQGKPRSAAKWAEECMQHAETDTAISRCQALAMCAIPLALWNREQDRALALAARLRQVAQRHSLGYWLYWAERVDLVLAQVQAGSLAQPDARLFRSGTAEANLRDHLCTFDPRLLGADVLERIDTGLVGWCAPEALRARAIAAMRLDAPDFELAERLLRESVMLARGQGALAWELRAATALAQVLGSTGRAGQASVQLAATIAQFEEGARTADLLDAHDVLANMAVAR